LAKYTNQEDIIIGSPIVGRPHPDLENMIGIFVNTLAMRNAPNGTKTITGFLDEVKENSLLAFENQDYQFERLIEKLGLKWNLSRNPLFDVVLVLQNIDNPSVTKSDLTFAPFEFENKMAKFDLTLNAVEATDGLYFNIEYRTRLFKPATIETIAKNYLDILQAMVSHAESKISDIELTVNVERLENTAMGIVDFDF
jgi:non-ribosomal peptide synthetase component F